MQRRLIPWLVLAGLLALAVVDTHFIRPVPSGIEVAVTPSEKMGKGKSPTAIVKDKSGASSNCPTGAKSKTGGCK